MQLGRIRAHTIPAPPLTRIMPQVPPIRLKVWVRSSPRTLFIFPCRCASGPSSKYLPWPGTLRLRLSCRGGGSPGKGPPHVDAPDPVPLRHGRGVSRPGRRPRTHHHHHQSFGAKPSRAWPKSFTPAHRRLEPCDAHIIRVGGCRRTLAGCPSTVRRKLLSRQRTHQIRGQSVPSGLPCSQRKHLHRTCTPPPTRDPCSGDSDPQTRPFEHAGKGRAPSR